MGELNVLANFGNVTIRCELRSVVWMYARCVPAEPGVRSSDARSATRCSQRLTDADDGRRAGLPSARDDLFAIRIEGGIGEVGVTVDEGRHEYTNRRAGRRFVGQKQVPCSARDDIVLSESCERQPADAMPADWVQRASACCVTRPSRSAGAATSARSTGGSVQRRRSS